VTKRTFLFEDRKLRLSDVDLLESALPILSMTAD
jgi:hypothetical protein